MKTIKKNVYYCDHCKKRGLSSGHMKGHEKKCTANPDRECRLCNQLEGGSPNIREIVEAFKKRYVVTSEMQYDNFSNSAIGEELKAHWIGEPVTLQEIRDAVNNCPNCILAVMRQSKFTWYPFQELKDQFNYKEEFDKAMQNFNSSKREESSQYY